MMKIKIKPFKQIFRSIITFLMVISLSFPLISCSDRLEATTPFEKDFTPLAKQEGSLTEVSPPPVIQELRKSLQKYQPQVKIISPKSDQTLNETTVKVQLEVKDFPLFKNEEKGMGNHLHLILDNEPYKAIYSVKEPIILDNLTPGSHILRVFPVRPWHESFKNDGAYAQTIFHVLTKTEESTPDSKLPLLTYSRPTGVYGAEPIMLDFYLTNTPLHLVAQENPQDEVADWRIKVTINGQTFLLDTWQPIYLKGFKKGNNWVKLEFIDETGNEVKNVFNNTVRLIKYEPNGQDIFSKMIRNELTFDQLKDIIDPTYVAPVIIPKVEEKTEIKPVEITPEIPVKVEEKTEISPVEIPERSKELKEEITPEIIATPEVNLKENVEELSQEKIENKEETPLTEEEKLDTSVTEKTPLETEELFLPEKENETIVKEEENTETKTINTNSLEAPSVIIENEKEISETEITETTENQGQSDFVKSVTNFWNNLLQQTK